VPGKDYICAAAPGTANAYTFNVDSFAMFKLKDASAQKAQADLAAAIMGTEFQEVFNLNKGSIPVRLAMDMDKFDDCAKLSSQGLCRHRQVRRPGAVHRPRHGGQALLLKAPSRTPSASSGTTTRSPWPTA
jgi:ABC-type glycerol-3-phosphate transport system substrate-binding protein